MAGILGLPPGLRGYVAGEEMENRRGQNTLGMLGGVMGLQNQMAQQQQMAQMGPLQLQLLQEQLRQAQAPRPPMVMSPGSSLIDPNNPQQPIFTAPATPKEPRVPRTQFDPTTGRLIDLDSGGSRPVEGIAPRPEKPPARRTQFDSERGVLVDLDTGTASPVPGVGPKPEKPTEPMLTAKGFMDRMSAAERVMGPLETAGIGTPEITESVAGVLPVIGKLASNVARSDNRQLYRQAQEDWVRAKLRKESGAVIADEEMDREIRTYFPQIGDGQKVIEQKRVARKTALESMRTSSGSARGVENDPLGLR